MSAASEFARLDILTKSEAVEVGVELIVERVEAIRDHANERAAFFDGVNDGNDSPISQEWADLATEADRRLDAIADRTWSWS